MRRSGLWAWCTMEIRSLARMTETKRSSTCSEQNQKAKEKLLEKAVQQKEYFRHYTCITKEKRANRNN